MYHYSYNEVEDVIRIRPSAKGFTALCLIAWLLFGGSGIFLVLVGDPSVFVSTVGVLIALSYTLWVIYICRKECITITREGVWYYLGKEEKGHLRWDECPFVHECKAYPKDNMYTLVCSKYTVPWDEKGRYPKDFVWPEDPFELPWLPLTKEQQNQILEFCGGMRGGPQ